MLQSLDGKVAWITGAGTGIGEAAAIALAREGVNVVLSGRRREPLEEAARKITGKGEPMIAPLDVRDQGAVQAAMNDIKKRFGRLDILFANAGINVPNRRWGDLTPEGWRDVVDIDLNGAFYCVHAVLPTMREQKDGLIINLSSWAGKHVSYLSGAAYTAAKHAMVAMSQSINIEEFRNGIRSCALCPAEVATPILDKRPVPVSAEDRARMLQPDDLAETVLFLARMPPSVCVNEILISPTWNRSYLGYGTPKNPGV